MIRMKHTLIGLALLATGCSSGGDSYTGIEGTGDTATAYGMVTGFGSVYVNGIHFNTDDAKVEINGQAVSESDLTVGMVVEVSGEFDQETLQGKAEIIRTENLMDGVITSVDEYDWSRKSFEMLGQTVFFNDETTLVDLEEEQIAPGTHVVVNGFITTNGFVNATQISVSKFSSTEDPVELEGYISTLDSAAFVFTLNDLTVSYSEAEFAGGDSNDLRVNKKVEVNGVLNSTNNTLEASKITFKNRSKNFGKHLRIEGIMQASGTTNTFYVNDTLVDISQARIEHASADDIKEGSRLVVEGSFANDLLMAEKIFLKSQYATRFKGNVETIDTAAKSINLFDSVFYVNEFTSCEDKSDFSNRFFKFEDISPGDEIEVFAKLIDEQWVATRIVRFNNEATQEHVISGRIETIQSETSFKVMGVNVDGSALTSEDLALIAVNKYVIVEGQPTGMFNFKAEEISIYDEMGCDDVVFFECDAGGEPPPPPPESPPKPGPRM